MIYLKTVSQNHFLSVQKSISFDTTRALKISEQLDGTKESASFEIAALFTRINGKKGGNFKTIRFFGSVE